MKTNWKKNMAVFLSSQGVSLLGSSLVQFAITWHITLTTQSGSMAALAIVCGFLPTLLLSPFAGVWADRYDRKRLIMLADGGIALCTLLLALAYFAGYREIWMLMVVLGVRALGGAVQTPAIGALLPELVPEERLTRANGLNSSVQSLIMLASPMLSGALMGAVPLEAILLVDVGTAALAIGVLLFLKTPARTEKPAGAAGSYLAELRQGFRYIGANASLKHFFVFCAFFYVVSSPVAFLTPLQVSRFFGNDVWRLTAVEIVFSAGMLLGGLGMAAWGGLKNRVHTMALSVLVLGVCTIGLGLPRVFGVYLGLVAVFGLAVPVLNTPAMVYLQERVPPDYMGRVFGVMTMLSSSIMPLAMLVFGPLADVLPIENMLRVTGVLTLLAAGVMLKDRPLVASGAAANRAGGRPAPERP